MALNKTMNAMTPRLYKYLIVAFALLTGLSACKKLPADLDYLSPEAVYAQTQYRPILGRTTLYSRVFNTDNSSTPIHFEISNVRYRKTGKPTNDLEQEVPVLVWKAAYTGDEKSVEEINAKRVMEDHPLWEVRETSGDLILWASADSMLVHQQPDSGYLFDVVATNSGGAHTYRNMILAPYREQPYQPYDRDAVTGERLKKYPNPGDSSIFEYQYIHPSVIGIVGDSTDENIMSDSVRVLFHKTGDGNSLSFKFLNKDSTLIDPAKFNRTVWDSVLHGFNVKITKESVRYDVAYPIPVVRYHTRFTNGDGSQANVSFRYDRVGFGGLTYTSLLNFSFAIHQKGDWEILFYFHSDNPRFRDE